MLLETPPSISLRPSHSTGGKIAGNGRAGEDRLDRVALGEAKLAPGEQIGGDDREGDRRLLQPSELRVGLDQPAQAVVGNQVIAEAEEADEPGQRR